MAQNNSAMEHTADMWPKCEKWAKITPKTTCAAARKFIPGMKTGLTHYQLLAVFVAIKFNGGVDQQHGAMVRDDLGFGKVSIHSV